jgi:Arc/MetJ-type ribon-helix-helix transcriptional regulator
MRGDFKSRSEGARRAIQTASSRRTRRARSKTAAPKPGGDKLYIQGATVPIEMAGTAHALAAAKTAPNDNGNGDNADAGTKD